MASWRNWVLSLAGWTSERRFVVFFLLIIITANIWAFGGLLWFAPRYRPRGRQPGCVQWRTDFPCGLEIWVRCVRSESFLKLGDFDEYRNLCSGTGGLSDRGPRAHAAGVAGCR